ncbi:MAG: leucine-rich repeat protein [Capnocytophaga gingivalis]|uniref:leucine-rich repeat domain-containing protein n=1 Tax=Capnocytophaga gingivalis TaxID=1017 RepID=UPI000F1CBECB|nr:leucine-rich repeat domain-containing protein [Capnocytophaga gingivalis]RKW18737.1 MAG: leucine-rich repeat domain-containing protein [Capnocytophaga sp.]
MKNLLLLTSIFFALMGCSKGDGDNNRANSIRSTENYDISGDGRTLIKWKNPNTTSLDMQADNELRKVNTIGEGAFKEHKHLQSITFPDNLKEIEAFAFEEADLSGEVVFNTAAMVDFGEKAFFNAHLKKVTLPNIRLLSDSAFSLAKLEEIYFNKVNKLGFGAISWNYFKVLHLENTELTEIQTVGISGCMELESVFLPATLTAIGYDAFWYCNKLKTVTILAVNPPVLVNNPFRSTALQKIYVPSSSVERYKRANYWSAFSDKIYPKP